MKKISNITRLSLIVLVVLSIASTGCSAKSATGPAQQTQTPAAANTTSATAEATTSASAAADAQIFNDISEEQLQSELKQLGGVLKVPAGDWSYIADKKGWFQRDFGDVKVELVQGVSGNEVQLMSRGDVYFAGRMLYPFLLFRSRGADIKAVQFSAHPIPEVTSIVVLSDSPYQTFDDLKGQTIATDRASCPYMVLFELTEDRNWKEGEDWKFLTLKSTDFKTALLSKNVAAVSNHPSEDIATMLLNGSAREIAFPAEDSVYIQGGGSTVIFTTEEFAEKYPNITKKYIQIQESTQYWIIDNQDEAAEIIEGITRVPPAISKQGWARRATGNWAFSERDLAKVKAEAQRTFDWLVDHGDFEPGSIDEDEVFDPQYFKQ